MQGCAKIYKTSAVTSDGTNLTLEIPVDFTAPQERQAFNFVICQKIPANAESLPVQISIAGNDYPLWNKYGEQATGNELRCRKLFCGYYGGVTSKHFITCDAPVCCGCCK